MGTSIDKYIIGLFIVIFLSACGVNHSDETSDNSITKPYTHEIAHRGLLSFSQEVYVKASNTGGGGDSFGTSVSLLSNVVVGAEEEDGNGRLINGDDSNDSSSAAGAAYVYQRFGSNDLNNTAIVSGAIYTFC